MLDKGATGYVSMATLKRLLIREKFLKREYISEPVLRREGSPSGRYLSPRRKPVSTRNLLDNKRISPSRLLAKSKNKLESLLDMVSDTADQLVTFKQFSSLMHNLFEQEREVKQLHFQEHGDSVDITDFLECEKKSKDIHIK